MGRSIRLVAAVAVLLILATVMVTPSLAAKHNNNGKGKTISTVDPVCSVTPNPVAVGGIYTVTGSGFTAGDPLSVFVSDSVGTNLFIPAADANGNFSVSSYASWSGGYTVSVYDTSGRKPVYEAGCSFTAN